MFHNSTLLIADPVYVKE